MASNGDSYVFFLGGYDLEMVTLRDLLQEVAPHRLHDARLAWGARVSSYQAQVLSTLERGETPVLIELENDLELDPTRVLLVDHHGSRAGMERPSSLRQVFELLHLPASRWTRFFDLVAANDGGYIPALQAMGASLEEIKAIRAADRAAQGVTGAEEAAAEEAVTRLEPRFGGRLTLVQLPHARTSPVTDRLHPALGGPGYQNLLILSPEEVNVYGEGTLIEALRATIPGGWSGGALPSYGFWGHALPAPDLWPTLERVLCSGSPSEPRRGLPPQLS